MAERKWHILEWALTGWHIFRVLCSVDTHMVPHKLTHKEYMHIKQQQVWKTGMYVKQQLPIRNRYKHTKTKSSWQTQTRNDISHMHTQTRNQTPTHNPELLTNKH